MTGSFLVTVLARWAHILAAIMAVGGMFYLRVVLIPAAYESLTDDQHRTLRGGLLKRWKRVVMACIALLILSGVYNFFAVSLPSAAKVPSYHALFGIKVLAALGVFFVSSVLTGRSALAERARSNMPLWLTVNLWLALAVVLLSGLLRNLAMAG